MLILAVQHLLILSGTVVYPLVIIEAIGGIETMAASMVSYTMIGSGLATILLAMTHKSIGSGFLLPQSGAAAYIHPSMLAAKAGGLPLLFGMTMFAGLAQTLTSRIVTRLRKLLPTEISGLVIVMVGMSLVPTATSQFMGLDSFDKYTSPSEITVSIVTALTILGIYIWGNKTLRIYSILIGLFVGYIMAYIMGVITNRDIIMIFEKPFFSLPKLDLVGWQFDLELAIPFFIAALAVSLKATGDIVACQKISNANWVRPNMRIISRGLLASSVGTITSGFLGGLGQTTVSANIGFAAATGVLSRHIGYYVGALLIGLAFFPQVIFFLTIMPKPVMGAILIFLIAFIIITGVQIITSRMLDSRKTFVIGIPMIFGLGAEMYPGLYDNVHPYLQPIFGSSLSIATMMAIGLNLLFRIGIYKRKVIELATGQKDANEIIVNTLQKQGALWGTRPEVIKRATAALIEFTDATTALKLHSKTYKIYLAYDDLSLKAEILYRGDRLPQVSERPDAEELMNDEGAYTRLAGFMLDHYADRVRINAIRDFCRVGLYFDL